MYAMRHVDENRVKIASLGGIEVILTAMKEHKSHEKIQRYGCGALSTLAVNGRNRREYVVGVFVCVLAFACDFFYL